MALKELAFHALLRGLSVALVFIFGAASFNADAQAPAAPGFEHELTRLEAGLTALKESIASQRLRRAPDRGEGTPETRAVPTSESYALVTDLLKELAKIDAVLPPSWPGDQPYVVTFGAYADVVEVMAAQHPQVTGTEQVTMLRDLRTQLRDLRIALYSPLAMDSQGQRGITVAVTVRAVSRGAEMRDLQVHCTPFALRDVDPNLNPFRTLTTTDAEQLLPGHYRFRLFRGKQLVAVTDQRVGMDGHIADLIEVSIP